MIIYLIKSALILSIVLVGYMVFLEKEKMHQFNRFYLLLGLIIALIAPLVTVGYLESTEVPAKTSTAVVTNFETSLSPVLSQSFDWTSIILLAYFVVFSFLSVRFLNNVIDFIKTIKNSDSTTYRKNRLVLVEKRVLPHTFLNFIFLNKDDYQNKRIEEALFTHEMTHAQELHSLDVLLVELAKVVFWFNPVLLWYKKAIQLNHEFIADQKVINSLINTKEYQSLLLQKASGNKEIYLASNINFSLTKKRLQMMTKSHSRWKAILYAGLSVPLFIGLFMSFGHYAIAQSNSSENDIKQKEEIFKNTTIVIKEDDEDKVYKSFDHLPDKYKKMIPLPPPPPPAPEGKKSKFSLPHFDMVHYDVGTNSLVDISGDELHFPHPPAPPAAPMPPNAAAPVAAPAAPVPPAQHSPLHEKGLKAPKGPKTVKAPKAPKPPKAVKPAKASKAIKAPKAPKGIVAPLPPPPPPPPNPIDMAIEIAKNGGNFMLNGKEVSSDKAIAALNSAKKIQSIDVNQFNGKDMMRINIK